MGVIRYRKSNNDGQCNGHKNINLVVEIVNHSLIE